MRKNSVSVIAAISSSVPLFTNVPPIPAYPLAIKEPPPPTTLRANSAELPSTALLATLAICNACCSALRLPIGAAESESINARLPSVPLCPTSMPPFNTLMRSCVSRPTSASHSLV
ncbi:hypothetical protein VE30_01925 [Vreelandella aquamarina]|nr:hypothetical protein VE30_01925 [Halomonas meridiana]